MRATCAGYLRLVPEAPSDARSRLARLAESHTQRVLQRSQAINHSNIRGWRRPLVLVNQSIPRAHQINRGTGKPEHQEYQEYQEFRRNRFSAA